MSLDNKQLGDNLFAFELNNILKQLKQLALAIIDLANFEDTVIASDVLQSSADTERYIAASNYQKVKEILIKKTGVARIKFDLKVGNNSYPSAYGRIYKNGVASGTERSTSSNTYGTYSEDLSVVKGDLIQLYYKCDQPGNTAVYVQNFRIYYTDSLVSGSLPVVNTN